MTLEVCAGSIESIKAAYEGGADRVEVCSALSEDGLTPSVGMIRKKKYVYLRPKLLTIKTFNYKTESTFYLRHRN